MESALGRHLRELRANVGTDALFVTIIEQNYGGWVGASRVAGLCDAFQPCRHMSRDKSGKGKIGVVTTHEVTRQVLKSSEDFNFFKFVLGQGGDAFRASGSTSERAFRVRQTVCDAVWRDTRGDAKAAEGVSLRGQDDGSDDEARVDGEGTRCVVVLSRAFFISNVNYFFNRKERRLVHCRTAFGVLVKFSFFLVFTWVIDICFFTGRNTFFRSPIVLGR